MVKKILSYLGIAAVIGLGVYAYLHFTQDQSQEDLFHLAYLPEGADYILEFNSIDHSKINQKALSNILPEGCQVQDDYKDILQFLNEADFKKGSLAIYNCKDMCILIETNQNMSRLKIEDWSISKKTRNLWQLQNASINGEVTDSYHNMQAYLKPSDKARAIVRMGDKNVYSIHEISGTQDNMHFTGFVVNEAAVEMSNLGFEMKALSEVLPSSTSQFEWMAIASKDEEFKENELKECVKFSVQDGAREINFTALKMRINSKKAQDAFRVSNSKIGLIGNTNWMEEQIPEMDAANHYSLIKNWIVCAAKSEDLKSYSQMVSNGNFTKNTDYPSFSSKLGLNLSSLKYSKLDGGAMEIVQNIYTTEGQHYNIIDILDADQSLAISEPDEMEQIEPDNFEMKQIAELTESPFEFINHYTKEMEWVIQDEEMNLVLMNKQKEILFKRKLDSPVMGEFKMVDALKNNKYQILFNTENYIYLVDRKGRDVENYPIKLASPASNELAVVDYENNKNYRLMLGLDNGEILNYNIDGKAIRGWKYKKNEKVIIYPVTHLRLGNKDYLFTLNEDYEIQLLDRKGKIRHPLNNQPEGLDNMAFEIIKDNTIQSSGIRYNTQGEQKEFMFGKSSS